MMIIIIPVIMIGISLMAMWHMKRATSISNLDAIYNAYGKVMIGLVGLIIGYVVGALTEHTWLDWLQR